MTTIDTTVVNTPEVVASNMNSATADTMQNNINLAKKAHITSRDSAMEAVAHTYLVWHAAQLDLGKDWLQGQIDEVNQQIEAHNQAEKALRKRAKEVAYQVPVELAAANADDSKAVVPEISAEERANLVQLNAMTNKEWQARRKLPIKARRGANPFTTIVKFVMGFDTHSDASMTSRYATVLSWVDTHFAGVIVTNALDIVEAIKTAGGFELVCRQQGNIKIEGNENRMVQADINKSIRDFVKAAATKAPIKGALDFRAKSANDDFVVLIGRQNGDKIEVISDVSVRASDFDNIIARIEDEAFLPAEKSSQLVHRALSLGHIVEHGRPTSETVDGTKAGVKRQTERVMTLRSDAKGAAQLVLSAKYGDASAVVHVTPKAHAVDLGEVDGVFVLNAAQCMELDKKLNDRYQRRFISVQADAEPVIDTEQYEHCKLTWSASYCQQVDPDDKAGQTYYWDDLAQDKRKPFDVENYQWQFEVTADKAQFENALSYFTVEEDGKPKRKFPDEAMSLVFEGNTMTIKSADTAGIGVALEGTIAEAVELPMRPHDVSVLLAKLVNQDADSFTIKGDEAGLFAISWTDALADYAVFIPTCKTDLSLESRRVAPMRKIGPVTTLAQKAA